MYVRVCVHVAWGLVVNRCNGQHSIVSSGCQCVVPALFLPCPQFPLKSRDYVFVRRLQVKRNGSLIVLINSCELVPTCLNSVVGCGCRDIETVLLNCAKNVVVWLCLTEHSRSHSATYVDMAVG